MDRKTIEVLWPSDGEEQDKNSDRKLRVAAYCRLSIVMNEKHLNSLENQLNHYTYYLTNHENYKLMGLYYDKNISGTAINNRPGFKRLLRHCEEGLIDLVITKSISRFSRNAKDLLEVVDHLSELGIPVIFEKENINTAKRKNKFFLTVLAGLSQEEIVGISNNVTWSKNNRVASGKPIYRRVFGYEIIKVKDGKVPRIIEDEAKVVRDIFDLYLSGMKINQIAKLLTEKGIQTTKGYTIWTHPSVKYILTNRTYIGEQIINKNRSAVARSVDFMEDLDRNIYVIENAFDRIIFDEDFEKVQIKISEVKVKKTRNIIKSHSCSKRIHCGLCDLNYNKSTRGDITGWCCGTKIKQTRLCDSPRMNDNKILILMKEEFKHKYDFTNPNILKKLIYELEQFNKNDRFEFHRLSLLSQLQIAKAKKEDSANNEDARIDIEMKEQAILDFEHLAGMIEDDRRYREYAIKLLRKAQSPEEFLESADIDSLRAWIMEITIFSLQDYKIHWFNDSYTIVGDGAKLKAKMEVKRSFLLEGELILKPALKKKSIILEENYEDMAASLEDSAIFKYRGDRVKAVKLEDYSSLSFQEQIRKEIRVNIVRGKEPSINKLRIAVYARVSTDDPNQLGSLEAQMAYYTYAVLKNPEYRLVQVYYDEGVSGTKAENRPGFQQMIADCQKGKIDRVITKSISRFARNTVDCLEYVRELKSMGISIFFEKEEIDSADNDGEILLTVYSALAQEESRSLGESISWGMRKMAERGIIKVSMLPYGYVYGKDQKWEIEQEKANVITKIYNEYLLGLSMQNIANELTDKGIPTPSNKNVWTQPTVNKILKNPAYKGQLVYQKEYIYDTISKKRRKNNGELPLYYIEDNHQAIIDKDLWNKVQDIIISKQRYLKTNKGNREKPKGRDEFFKMFYCEHCGCLAIHRLESRHNEKHYWRCQAATKKDQANHCNEKGLREENLEHTFMVMLQELKDSNNLIKLVNEAIECIKLKPNEMEMLHWLQIDIENRYESLYDIVEEGKKYGEDTEAIKSMTDQIMELHDSIRTLEDRIQKVKEIKEELKWLKKELLKFTTFDPKKERVPFRGDIFSRLVKVGMLRPGGIIEYTLNLGIKWITKDNLDTFWKLPMKAE